MEFTTVNVLIYMYINADMLSGVRNEQWPQKLNNAINQLFTKMVNNYFNKWLTID